jgi:hypothetical protein
VIRSRIALVLRSEGVAVWALLTLAFAVAGGVEVYLAVNEAVTWPLVVAVPALGAALVCLWIAVRNTHQV